jgi:branched-chain amino acid transport system permease protein
MNRKTLIAAVIGLALLAAFPLMSGNSYYVHMVGTIMIYAILLFGLDIVVGYTGPGVWAMPACSASPTPLVCCS